MVRSSPFNSRKRGGGLGLTTDAEVEPKSIKSTGFTSPAARRNVWRGEGVGWTKATVTRRGGQAGGVAHEQTMPSNLNLTQHCGDTIRSHNFASPYTFHTHIYLCP